MDTVRIAGRTYSDPDVLALAASTGGLVDPRSAVLNQARKANAQYRDFDPGSADPLERIKIIASLHGITVSPMNLERKSGEDRDAVLIPTSKRRQILYNPNRPKQRIAFSIAHEISHIFFPNTISGARFRNIHESSSKEANELERLCDLGAAELLMPIEDFQAAAAGDYSIANVDHLAGIFGSSFEATVYRMATANPDRAVAGLLKFRHTQPETRLLAKEQAQRQLFPGTSTYSQEVKAKYRRQSLHLSESCDAADQIHWNKSFDEDSVVYTATERIAVRSFEELPNQSGRIGRLEAICAPYKREDSHAKFSDVLFFWQEI